MNVSPHGVGVLLVLWALALSYLLLPKQCSRWALRLRLRMIGPERHAARLLAPREFRRLGVLMVVTVALLTAYVIAKGLLLHP